MVEASAPDFDEGRTDEPRDSFKVTDAKIFEDQGNTADLFTEDDVMCFTVRNP